MSIDSDLVTRQSQQASSTALVPTDFAEKAMASLMQLHSELMDEKERRVDLYRRLMEKEQAVAELRMYVKLLEEKVGHKDEVPAPALTQPRTFPVAVPAQPPVPKAAAPKPAAEPALPTPNNVRPFGAPPAAKAAASSKGWRSW
jgi:hypothetical protein